MRFLIFQEAFKRCVIAAKGIENHFCAETEADNERIKAAFAHQFSVCVAEIKEQRLVDSNIYKALDELAARTEKPAEPFSEMSAERLVEFILTKHHSYLWGVLPEAHELIVNVLKAHGRRHPELYDVYKLFGQLSHEMEPHLIREETELFPAIANSEAKEHCQALVHILEEEHEAAGTLLKKLRHATNDYSVPCDGCDTFRELYKKLTEIEEDTLQHYHLENNILFKKILV